MTARPAPAGRPVTHATRRALGTSVRLRVARTSAAGEARCDSGEGGFPVGCGGVSFAGPDTRGVRATAEIMTFMAGESAAQCGPGGFGLVAVADATGRRAGGASFADDQARISRALSR